MWLFKCRSSRGCIILVRWYKIRWRMYPCIIPVPWWICIYMSIGRHPRHWHWRPKIRIWICCIKILTLPIPILIFAPWGWSWFLCMIWPISILLFTLLLIFIQYFSEGDFWSLTLALISAFVFFWFAFIDHWIFLLPPVLGVSIVASMEFSPSRLCSLCSLTTSLLESLIPSPAAFTFSLNGSAWSGRCDFFCHWDQSE